MKRGTMKWPQRRFRQAVGFATLPLASLLLISCEEPQQVDRNVVRAIKWTALDDHTLTQQRLIAGILKPVQSTDLGFQVGGRVMKVKVELGDRIQAGQVLATLDSEPFVLQVRHAEAEVATTNAVYRDEGQELERQQKLFADGWVAKAKLEAVEAGYEAARSQKVAAQEKLRMRQRDLRHSTLHAPFSGVISKKDIDPFEEVTPGQSIFEVSSEHRLKVALRVPPSLVTHIDEGGRVKVRFPSEPSLELAGTITEIGSRAEEANAFPVTVVLDETSTRLRAGMSAEVAFTFRNGDSADGTYVVPMGAILPGNGQSFHSFIFDKDSSTVKKATIEVVNYRDNDVEVSGDLQPGTIIATAGIEFLHDGQEVKLMGTEMPYGDGVKQ